MLITFTSKPVSAPEVVLVTVAKASVLVSISVAFVKIEFNVVSVAAPVGKLIVPEMSFISQVPD